MSTKDRVMNVMKRKSIMLKKINPKYYALVVGLILAAILVKKFRAKITNVLKVILNI